jgi:predicted GIY-YIG superfamily endonuclease
MVFIYILQLEDNKFYIGKTDNPGFRLNSHFNYNGSTWTKKFKPIKVIKLIPNCNNFDEDRYTKEYMSKKGINNVRGGSYCKIKLDNNEIELLKKEINTACDFCYICGSNQHFAGNCDNDNDYNNITVNKLTKQLNSLLKEQDRCFRCHRAGHFAINCYAKKDIHGKYIQDEDISEEELIEVWSCSFCNREFETEKGAKYHENFYCKNKPSNNSNYRKKFNNN